MTTPARTEFEAAAYRWLRDHCHPLGGSFEVLDIGTPPAHLYTESLDTAIAAAMGWPTVPEVKS